MLATSGFNHDHRSPVLKPTRALAPMADEQFSSVADPPCTCGAVRLRCGFMPVSQVCIIFDYSIAGFSGGAGLLIACQIWGVGDLNLAVPKHGGVMEGVCGRGSAGGCCGPGLRRVCSGLRGVTRGARRASRVRRRARPSDPQRPHTRRGGGWRSR